MASRFASNLHTFGYESGNSEVVWDVTYIWKAAENIRTTRYPVTDFLEYIRHVQRHYDKEDETRVKEADLSYPPIISSGFTTVEVMEGSIIRAPLVLDGCHRLAKLIEKGANWVDVKVLEHMPAPIYVKGKPFTIEGLNFTWRQKEVSNEAYVNSKWLHW